MKAIRASFRYAKAFLEFAEEVKSSKAVTADIQSILTLMSTNEELNLMLENPMLGEEKKEAILNELMPKANEQTKKFFSLLANNNRIGLLVPACKQYLQLFSALNGEVMVTVTTAVPLTADLKKQVLQQAKKLSDKKAVLENKIDPAIIGGYILKIGDKQLDASLSNQLKAIKTTLTKTNSI